MKIVRNCFIPQINNNFSKNHKSPFSFKGASDSFAHGDSCIESAKLSTREPVIFKKPIPLELAMVALVRSNNKVLEETMHRKLFNKEILTGFVSEVMNIPEISDIKVKNLFAIGCFALVFETEDGKILKILEVDHFPFKRKPDDFDAPIEKSGKGRYLHYYLEKKGNVDDVSEDEIKNLCNYIESKGYILKDVKYLDGTTKKEQFARFDDGKVYLIDPQCAVRC